MKELIRAQLTPFRRGAGKRFYANKSSFPVVFKGPHLSFQERKVFAPYAFPNKKNT